MHIIGFLCPLFFTFVALAASGILAFFAVRMRRRAAVLAETPYSKAEELDHEPGRVCKIKGRIAAQEDLLESPMSRRACVYFRFLVQEQRTHTTYNGRTTTTTTAWVNVVDDKQAIAVVVEDESGSVGVRLDEAEVVLKSAEYQQSGTFNEPPERLRRLLKECYGQSTKGLLFNKTMRYTESVLDDRARVIIVGEVVKGRRGLSFRKHEKVGLVVSDKSGQQLTSHYNRRALWLWIGSGAALVVGLGIGVVAAIFLISALLASKPAPPAPNPSNTPAAPAGFNPPPPPFNQPGAPQQPGGAPQNPGGGAAKQPQRFSKREGEPDLPKVPTRRGAMGPGSFDEALDWLNGDNQLYQLVACGSLAKAAVYAPRQTEVAAALEKLMNGRDALVKGESMKTLVVWATADQVPSLITALDTEKFFNRDNAMEALVRLKDPRGVPPLVKLLTEQFTREKVTPLLVSMGPMIEGEVRKYLSDPQVETREQAATVLTKLGKLSKDDEFTVAFTGLSDAKGSARVKALKWFAATKPDFPRRAEAARQMAKLLQDGGVFDKMEAAKALVEWATAAEVPAIMELLRRQRVGGQRVSLIRALKQLKDKRAVPILLEQLGNPFDGAEVEKALVAMGSSIEDEVVKVLDQKEVPARLAACELLRAVGTAKSLPALQTFLTAAQRQTNYPGPQLAKAATAAIDAIKSR